MKKTLSKTLGVCVLLGASLLAQMASAAEPSSTSSKKIRYPFVREVIGDVVLTLVNGENKKPAVNESLIEKAGFKTGTGSEVTVQLDADRYFRLLSNSEVLLPAISYESQETPLIILKTGGLRWWTPYPYKAAYNVAISSDLFQFILPAGEYVLSIDPKSALASVKVFEGKLEFSALNAETSVVVNKGQQGSFQGVLEEGAIAYDVLLQGKKIPRGKLLPLASVDDSEIREFERIQKEKAEAVKIAKAKAAAQKAKMIKQGYICQNPVGKFNHCLWRVEGEAKECFRLRCNANGDWAEKTSVSAEKARSFCGPKARIAPCDY